MNENRVRWMDLQHISVFIETRCGVCFITDAMSYVRS